MSFVSKPVSQFLEELASAAPTPGGGSSAALAGALAAGLISMVCNLTIGKKGYEDVQEIMKSLLRNSEALRSEICDLIDADVLSYEKVMAAYRLPRKTPAERESREVAIQEALKEAAQVPLRTARCCAELVDLALPVADMGNRMAVSDAAVGALLAEASMHGALMNVYVNLSSIRDLAYVEEVKRQIADFTANKADTKDQVLDLVLEKIGV